MACVVRIEFAGPERRQYCPAPGYTLKAGDVVVVETDWGVGMGQVENVLEDFPAGLLKPPVRRVLRMATSIDLSRRSSMAQREREVHTFCHERIQARNLPMKLTEVRIGLDNSKAMFYFTAEGRVDFRELVKDLTQHLRTRVELRQIGVRDEAKVLGSAGPCGRSICCQAFLQTFAPVSIRMAKDQNLALNPGKLSGMCGRLKCCLAFEHPLYAELRKHLPRVGTWVTTLQGPGQIRSQNILEQTVLVSLDTGGQVILRPSEVTLIPRLNPPPRRQRTARAPSEDSGAERAPGEPHAGGRAGGPRVIPRGGAAGGPSAPQPKLPDLSSEEDEIPPDVAALED
jgi:cell fate regulator YaaT (PSP1 superfamily)